MNDYSKDTKLNNRKELCLKIKLKDINDLCEIKQK